MLILTNYSTIHLNLGVILNYYFKKIFILILLIISYVVPSFGAHIIGGEMYYECLGYGQDSTFRRYLITIKLYRDCRPQQNAAFFDQPLGFTIYQWNATQRRYLNTLPNNREYSIQNLTNGPDQISPPSYPCLILPPDICGEEGTYQTEVELKIINEEYVIVWQRCCRNNTISNILSPGSTGATFTISIHPEAQKSCNSSPVFKNFPPTVICVNNPIAFDHSAYDKDGDLLVYSFCEPFAGGGMGGGGAGNCNSVTPTPDCPPPFTPVTFRAPQYNYIFPMGGNPPVTISSLTGLITGEPNTQGQFVVTVCCSEYRNGILLSTVRRDFQFNVASCQGTVVASMGNGLEVSRQHYEILLCNSDSLKVNNTSTLPLYIKDVFWQLQNGGSMDSFNIWSPTFKFKESGYHDGKLILNPGTNCSDTAYFRINVIDKLIPDFYFQFDSCQAGPVAFTDLSSSTASIIQNWLWDLGDGFKAFQPNPTLQYIHPDEYNVRLDITDNFGCKNFIQKKLKWYPAPNVVVFRPNQNEGCVPLKVNFKNISFPTDNSYQFKWKFTDGFETSGFSVNHTFDSVGSFGVKLEVISPVGCYSEGIFNDVIKVYPPPTAVWSVDPLRINLNNPTINLYDSSANTIGRTWIINDQEFFFDRDFSYSFKDTGYYKITLIATDRFLCNDTLETMVFVYKDFSLYMPNAFSPNGDGLNETFEPVGQLDNLIDYKLSIYDRWGGKIYESSNPKSGWNGRTANNEKELPPGAYVYQLEYQSNRNSPVKEKKLFTLIR